MHLTFLLSFGFLNYKIIIIVPTSEFLKLTEIVNIRTLSTMPGIV